VNDIVLAIPVFFRPVAAAAPVAVGSLAWLSLLHAGQARDAGRAAAS
jgi:hypothetical protein